MRAECCPSTVCGLVLWIPHRPVFLLTQSIKIILKSTEAFLYAAWTGMRRHRAVEERTPTSWGSPSVIDTATDHLCLHCRMPCADLVSLHFVKHVPGLM